MKQSVHNHKGRVAEPEESWVKQWKEIEVGTWEIEKRGKEQTVFKESNSLKHKIKESNCLNFHKPKKKTKKRFEVYMTPQSINS